MDCSRTIKKNLSNFSRLSKRAGSWTWANTLLLGLLVLGGCTSSPTATDPRGRLQEYISKSFAVRGLEQRSELLVYLTGDAKRRLSLWSDDQFQEAFIDSKRQFLKLLFREENKTAENEVSITYELLYLDKSRAGTEVKVTAKKICVLKQENGSWQIASVKNIKELVEYQDEMSLP